ncbi:MAG TPA: amidase [Desulfomonilaceae bacterium]|nr:amidase [Desulfomonilaceae bacterium]
MFAQQPKYDAEGSGAFIQLAEIQPIHDGLLNGLRFAVKDLMDVAGYKTSCGNPTWRDTHPAAAGNAVCVDQLLHSGAACIGKTVTDELAFGLDGENYFYGTPVNPGAPDRVPGGSSSGSASAVACGLADFALGTDTGGSVRIPAANCGIYGFRPTHGVISVAGVNPLAPTFDTVGVLAGTLPVLVKVASVLLGRWIDDEKEVGTIHILSDAFALSDDDVVLALDESLTRLKSSGVGTIKQTSLHDVDTSCTTGLKGWYETYLVLQWTEIWSCLGSWILDVKPPLGPRTMRNFELTRNVDRSLVPGAVCRRETYFELVKEFLGPNDLICIPTSAAPAPAKGTLTLDRTTGNYYPRVLSLTSIAGIGRLPQVTLPVADVGGIPVGISFLAAHGRDEFLLSAVQRIDSLGS